MRLWPAEEKKQTKSQHGRQKPTTQAAGKLICPGAGWGGVVGGGQGGRGRGRQGDMSLCRGQEHITRVCGDAGPLDRTLDWSCLL